MTMEVNGKIKLLMCAETLMCTLFCFLVITLCHYIILYVIYLLCLLNLPHKNDEVCAIFKIFEHFVVILSSLAGKFCAAVVIRTIGQAGYA
jgi:hypothetical protein